MYNYLLGGTKYRYNLRAGMMKLFYSRNNELRSGWKVVRVIVLVIVLAAVFVILAALLKIEALGDYAVHLAMIIGVLSELRLEHRPLSFIGIRLRDKVFWTDSLSGFAWGCLFIGAAVAGMVLITKEMTLDQFGKGFHVPRLAYSLIFWLVVAIGEEILFRGYILSILRPRMKLWAALIISACIFSSIHIINPDFYWFAYVYAILIGVAFGGIVVKRENLGGAIGFHYAWNLLQDQGILNTPARGGEGIYTVVLLVIAVIIFWVLPGRAALDEESKLTLRERTKPVQVS
jgi:membrane protease YdiL (CAAX protease family)